MSVSEKRLKRSCQFVGCSIYPGAGVGKLSIVWILTKYLIVHFTPERGQGQYWQYWHAVLTITILFQFYIYRIFFTLQLNFSRRNKNVLEIVGERI